MVNAAYCTMLDIVRAREAVVGGRDSDIPLLLFLPRPSLSITSSAHCILLSLLSPGLLIAPRSLNTGCWCRVEGE